MCPGGLAPETVGAQGTREVAARCERGNAQNGPAVRGGSEREPRLCEGRRPRGAQSESRLTSGAGRAAAQCSRGRGVPGFRRVPGVRGAGAEGKPGIPEGLVRTAPAAASPGGRAPPSPLAACRAPGRGGTLRETCRRPCRGERGLRTDPTRTLKESLLMTLRGSRTLSYPWRSVRPEDWLLGAQRRRASRISPTAGEEGGTEGRRTQGKEGSTPNSSALRGHPTCLRASAIRGSYLLRGSGWAVALFPSQGWGLFPGAHDSLFPLPTLNLVAFLSPSCPFGGGGERTTDDLLLTQEETS